MEQLNDGIEMTDNSHFTTIELSDKTKDFNQPATERPFDLEEDIKLSEASKADIAAWLEAYQNLMQKSISQVHALLKTPHWRIIEPAGRIQLYEKSTKAGYHTIKVQAILKVRPERLMYVIKDHTPETRLPWDLAHVAACREWETFNGNADTQLAIKVVSSEIIMGTPLIWNRFLLGIQWSMFDKSTRTYKLVFRTTQHRFHKPKEGTVAVNALIGIVIRVFDDPNQCELIIVTNANPGDSLPTVIVQKCKEWLRARVELYERVTLEWDTFYGTRNDPKKNRI